jgi:hypothetical protein
MVYSVLFRLLVWDMLAVDTGELLRFKPLHIILVIGVVCCAQVDVCTI